MKTILLKFSGPLQSWGTSSKFNDRETDLYPSKSAVVGIIAASFGYGRDEDDKIQKINEIDFGVRIDDQGRLLKDFQIVATYKNGKLDKNFVTNRYYIEDATFLCAISHEDDKFVEDIYNALKSPFWQGYMGRKSCPLPYDFLIGIYDDNIVNLLEKHKYLGSKSSKKNKARCYIDSKLLSGKDRIFREDSVESFSSKNRKYGYRSESKFFINLKVNEN